MELFLLFAIAITIVSFISIILNEPPLSMRVDNQSDQEIQFFSGPSNFQDNNNQEHKQKTGDQDEDLLMSVAISH